MSHAPGGALGATEQVASAARFSIFIPAWSTGLGFSKLTGFTTVVESAEYSFNGMFGNSIAKQLGRAKSPSITLERALDLAGFRQLLGWHMLARNNLPTAKVPCAVFTIMDAAGNPDITLELHMAWCAKLELDPVLAGASNIIHMRATIECDAIYLT